LDPEKLLKPKEYLRQTYASASKVRQPRIMQVNAKIPYEELNLKENFKRVHSAKTSTSKPGVKLETPEVIIPEIKFEIDQTIHVSIPTIVSTHSILSLPEVKVFVFKNHEDYLLYSDSFPITSPIYTSGKHEEPISSFPFPPHLYLSSSHDHFPEIHSHHPEVVERSVDQSFEVFENILFSARVLSPRLSMVGVGGVGGAGAGGKAQTPRIVSKVATRYSPLVLHVVLHYLPENYMKSLLKFTGERDLIVT
jgi:hypothetical protein